jgi:O-antigen/teichoic acid export membrane protein
VTDSQVSLRASAGAGLKWGVIFTLTRDVIQFLNMLILVRILSAEIYGQFAMAQTILISLSVMSLKTIAPFALQARNPREFDWDTHYSAGVTVNALIFVATLVAAAALYASGGASLKSVALVLAVLSLTFPAEMIGTYYLIWLQAHHQWRRMRSLLLGGALLSSIGAIALALAGAGVFSLAFGSILLILPLTVDYVVGHAEKPRFRKDWYRRYREGFRFGVNRSAAGALTAGSTLVEQSVFSGMFGFATLGLYTRAIGLAQITSGRIGPVVMQTLYPVLSRAEADSERFRRFASILYQGVLWTSFPAAAFLALEGERLVGLLYGSAWQGVVPLMAGAAALLAFRGASQTLNSILLANLQQSLCLRLDLIATLSSFALIAAAILYGPQIYLYALSAHALGILGLTAYAGVRSRAVAASDVIRLGGDCLVALGAAALVHTLAVRALLPDGWPATLHLFATGSLFALAYVVTLRLVSPTSFFRLIDAVPLPRRLAEAVTYLSVAPRRSL